MLNCKDIEKLAAEAGFPEHLVRELGVPAARILKVDGEPRIGASRLGGLPDLPEGLEWPRWDVREHDQEELEQAEKLARTTPTAFMKERAQQLRACGARGPLPLSFMAQLDLGELSRLSLGIPLPTSGLLCFFYEVSVQPWGFSPAHRGAWRVIHVPGGAKLMRREPPADLPGRFVLKPVVVGLSPTWSMPSSLEGHDDETAEAHDVLRELIAEADPGVPHQVGGFPAQIQGDMKRKCALASQGIYVGEPPDLPRSELDRLVAAQPDWRLLLQLCSDDEMEVMWEDDGKLFWWMRESDVVEGAWDRAWFKLQCY